MNTSIWTSYAYKTKNIDLAVISIVPLVISIILSIIYLVVKKEIFQVKAFVVVILVSQILNFDVLSTEWCGLLGTSCSVIGNLIPLSFMPTILKTKNVKGINLPLTYVGLFCYFIWLLYAILKQDLFMSLS